MHKCKIIGGKYEKKVVNVVSMSFGTESNVLSEEIRLAVDSDIICVAAANKDSTVYFTYSVAERRCKKEDYKI